MTRRHVLPFSETDIDGRQGGLVFVRPDFPVAPATFQLRLTCDVWMDVLRVGAVTPHDMQRRGNNLFDVVYTEIEDLRDGPQDAPNGAWPLRPVHVQAGSYLVAWLRNFDTARQTARGHFVCEAAR